MRNRKLCITYQVGRSKNHSTRFPIFDQHIRDVLSLMTSTRMVNTMRITVKMRKTKLNQQGARGTCADWKYNKKSRGSNSKHFEILLHSSCTLAVNLNTLTHELMHAVQFASGRLGWVHLKTHKITYRTWRPIGHTGAAIRYPYWDCQYNPPRKVIIPWADRPWEIEAMAAQEKYRHLIPTKD